MHVLNLVWVLILVLINGFFVAAEFALVKVRASQIEIKLQNGHALGKLAKRIHTHLDTYLSATQLGITITSLGVGWVGEGAVAALLLDTSLWLGLAIPTVILHKVAFGLAFFLITMLHIVVGELAPKSLAIQHPLGIMFAIAAPLRGFYILFSPFIWILNRAAAIVLRLVGLQTRPGSESHSTEELRLLLDQGKNEGLIRSVEHEIIKNVFYSSEKTVEKIMIPRSQIEALSITATAEEVLEKFVVEGYSRLPVYRDNLDNIVGILYAKEVLKAMQARDLHVEPSIQWKEKILKPHFVPESKKIITLLREFQAKRFHMVMIVDEFGSTSGLVTIEDIIEELVGEIEDEYDTETPRVEKTGKFEWRINGLAPISEVNQFLDPPLPETADYDTISGLLNGFCGHIPKVQDKMRCYGYDVTVLKASNRRVETVEFKRHFS